MNLILSICLPISYLEQKRLELRVFFVRFVFGNVILFVLFIFFCMYMYGMTVNGLLLLLINGLRNCPVKLLSILKNAVSARAGRVFRGTCECQWITDIIAFMLR